jgi:UDP-N-acetylmuramate--alanine ligase
MNKLNLSRLKKVYCIGIKGSGVTAVAEILKKRGVKISGSDTKEKFFTDDILRRNKIPVIENFSPENIPRDTELVVYSTAYNKENNVEFSEALDRKLPMLSYPEVLGALFNERLGIAVSGTHGKTTTTAMLAESLKEAGVDPGAVVGSQVIGWKSSALGGGGKYFVAEADEYQNKLRYYNPFGSILTSVDWDHPDYFPTIESYEQVFRDFVARIPKHGFLIVWGDSVNTLSVSRSATCAIHSYGFLENCDYRIVNHQILESKFQSFEITYQEKNLGEFEIKLVGKHNVLNAAAAIATCHRLKLDLEKVREALKGFKGTTRRFEYIGERNGAVLIDDYAHHPEEISATLKGAREIYPNKNIITVFHPHTFTRTKALLQEFSQSFDDTDKVIVLDIYGSAREAQGGVSSADLAGLINRYSREKGEYIPTINEAMEFLKDKIGPNDVVISMGAGNVWEVTHKLKD